MKDNGKKTKCMVAENLHFIIIKFMKVILDIILIKVLAYLSITLEIFMKAILKMEKCMDLEHSYTIQEIYTKDSMFKIRCMAMEYIHLKVEK